MLDITKLKLYPSFSRSVFIPSNKPKKFSVIFYPENSTLIEAYASLNLRKQFVKKATFLSAKLPILRNTMDKLMQYKQIKLIPFGVQKPKENVFIDCSQYLDAIDSSYGKSSYKRPQVLNKILDYLQRCQDHLPNSSILLYYIDMTKPCNPNLFFRRVYALIQLAKNGGGSFNFDMVCLVSKSNKGIIYSPIYNKFTSKKLSFSRIYSILKRFISKPELADDNIDVDDTEAAKNKIKSIVQNVSKKEKDDKPHPVINTITDWADKNRG